MESTDMTKPCDHPRDYEHEPLHPCHCAAPREVNFILRDEPIGTDEECRLSKEFSCHCGEFNPPGDRTPSLGEREMDDILYQPSYLDTANMQNAPCSSQPDNLCIFGGPFFRGVSETHEEFINRGGIEPRKYQTFQRHYQKPDMKHFKSTNQSDFGPPYPKSAKDKHPRFQEAIRIPLTRPTRRNPHLKEVDCKYVEPKLFYIDKEPTRDFNTEYGDNYVCYQMAKTEKKLMDDKPLRSEMYQDYVRKSHRECLCEVPYHLQNAAIDLSSILSPQKDLCTMLNCPPERRITNDQDISEKPPQFVPENGPSDKILNCCKCKCYCDSHKMSIQL